MESVDSSSGDMVGEEEVPAVALDDEMVEPGGWETKEVRAGAEVEVERGSGTRMDYEF